MFGILAALSSLTHSAVVSSEELALFSKEADDVLSAITPPNALDNSTTSEL